MRYSIRTLLAATTITAAYLGLSAWIARESGRFPFVPASLGFLFFFGGSAVEAGKAAYTRARSGATLLLLNEPSSDWRWHYLTLAVISLLTLAAIYFGVAPVAAFLVPSGLFFHLALLIIPEDQICENGIIANGRLWRWRRCSCRVQERFGNSVLEVKTGWWELNQVALISEDRVNEVRAILAEKQPPAEEQP